MAGRKINDVSAVGTVTSSIKMPASNGSGQAVTVTVGQLSDYITQGIDMSQIQALNLDIKRLEIWTNLTDPYDILALVEHEKQYIYSENEDGAGRIYVSFMSGDQMAIREERKSASTLYLYGDDDKPLRGYTYEDGALQPWALKKEVDEVEAAIPPSMTMQEVDAVFGQNALSNNNNNG